MSNIEIDPVERIKLLTAISTARQVESPIKSRGMPPIPIPVGSTLTAILKNGAMAYIEQLGPKMINSAIQIVGKDDSF